MDAICTGCLKRTESSSHSKKMLERLALNAPDEFSGKRRSVLIAVTVDRQRKVCSRFEYLSSRVSNRSQTQ
jgi:hypothetical protein